MDTILIKNAQIVNEGHIQVLDVFIKNGRIDKIAPQIDLKSNKEIDATGLFLIPGMIDDQVHFREPGLTHKATIQTESRAAVAGGITSFMEMPNTLPNTLSQRLLEDKYQIASKTSLANYSFFMGASNDNIEEVLKTNSQNICGIKIFMGSSTGNMLVDNDTILNKLFSETSMLIAVHCEDEATIRHNLEYMQAKYGQQLTANHHPIIRNAEACYLSSSRAVNLAKKYNTRLHILHISTEKELQLFDNKTPLKDKRITAEACIHHLWFSDKDYAQKGNFIKWNPAVKTERDRDAILSAVLDDKIDVIATDHAPHTLEEKQQLYLQAPSGGPLVQHALVALLEMYHQQKISLEKIVEKTSHNVATCFKIQDRGFVREGYWADLVLVDINKSWQVNRDNILYKCGWSPFDGYKFHSKITHTLVSGKLVYQDDKIINDTNAKRLTFNG